MATPGALIQSGIASPAPATTLFPHIATAATPQPFLDDDQAIYTILTQRDVDDSEQDIATSTCSPLNLCFSNPLTYSKPTTSAAQTSSILPFPSGPKSSSSTQTSLLPFSAPKSNSSSSSSSSSQASAQSTASASAPAKATQTGSSSTALAPTLGAGKTVALICALAGLVACGL